MLIDSYEAAISKINDAVAHTDINSTESEQEMGRHQRPKYPRIAFSPDQSSSYPRHTAPSSVNHSAIDSGDDTYSSSSGNDGGSVSMSIPPPNPPRCLDISGQLCIGGVQQYDVARKLSYIHI